MDAVATWSQEQRNEAIAEMLDQAERLYKLLYTHIQVALGEPRAEPAVDITCWTQPLLTPLKQVS